MCHLINYCTCSLYAAYDWPYSIDNDTALMWYCKSPRKAILNGPLHVYVISIVKQVMSARVLPSKVILFLESGENFCCGEWEIQLWNMKPETVSGRPIGESMAAGHDEYDDISLDKAYETVGLLITESRIPESSSKGRRDGSHAIQNAPVHKSCSETNEECQKVRRYREVMGGLCRNKIPLCVEVLLCPRCEIENADSGKAAPPIQHNTHEVGSAHSNCYVLLEQWTIQQVCSRPDSKLQPLQNLCNAVRSHLCFSQLSAWLAASQGVTPRHIFYRLTAPGEWFVHKFVMSPQSHKFPDASLGRPRLAVRVTLSSLPRTTLTPYEISIASRDKLFGVKDASPLLGKSRRLGTNTGSTSEEDLDDEIARAVTPNERTHNRSKSVRGLQDLTGRKSATELTSQHTYAAQRCLKYSDDSDVPFSPSLTAAEKLASFTAVPANSINKLEPISCATGKSPRQVVHPTRLPISSQKCSSLKSPKVLFTRTAADNKFFTVPSFDISPKIEMLPALDSEEEAGPGTEQENVNSLARNFERHSDANSSEEDFLKSSCSSSKDSIANSDNSNRSSSCQSKQTIVECTDNSQLHSGNIAARSNNCPIAVDKTLNSIGNEVHVEHDSSNSRLASNLLTNQSKSLDREESSSLHDDEDDKSYTRRSRRHSTQGREDKENLSGTPINKKLQNIKQTASCPPPSRSRLFRQRPLQSSPAPVKRAGKSFGYDDSINSVQSIKNAISCTSLSEHDQTPERDKTSLPLSSSAPAFTTPNKTQAQSRNSLLGNFEESLLNGRIDPAGSVDGFTVDIGASGAFCPQHRVLPVEAYFFNSLSDDDASSPYLGYVDLSKVSRRGYQIPPKGTLQITLFYPNHKVNKMFVVTYDLSDMPPKSQTFIRQKTVYAPCEQQGQGQATSFAKSKDKLPTYLRYLIHLRILSTKTNKIFLHTDIRLIYARDRFEFDPRVASYELRSFIEAPTHPKYSPLK
ncbi:FAM214A [Bugula neritina]|uniref:FAM214A n=1 Tax=Bugula neritina TaxID=10212 RepID=A0A7J7KHW6_BUGNE|nr:FAM214A [Bugula neritina]